MLLEKLKKSSKIEWKTQKKLKRSTANSNKKLQNSSRKLKVSANSPRQKKGWLVA